MVCHLVVHSHNKVVIVLGRQLRVKRRLAQVPNRLVTDSLLPNRGSSRVNSVSAVSLTPRSVLEALVSRIIDKALELLNMVVHQPPVSCSHVVHDLVESVSQLSVGQVRS